MKILKPFRITKSWDTRISVLCNNIKPSTTERSLPTVVWSLVSRGTSFHNFRARPKWEVDTSSDLSNPLLDSSGSHQNSCGSINYPSITPRFSHQLCPSKQRQQQNRIPGRCLPPYLKLEAKVIWVKNEFCSYLKLPFFKAWGRVTSFHITASGKIHVYVYRNDYLYVLQ